MEKLNADAGHAILEAAYLDNLLQQLLLHSMPKMSNGLAKELFGRSLNSFAAKINLACALRLIDAKTRCDLLAVKSVRNVFAHAEHALGFRHAKIIKEARPLRHHGHEGARELFDAAADAAEITINAKINELVYKQATG